MRSNSSLTDGSDRRGENSRTVRSWIGVSQRDRWLSVWISRMIRASFERSRTDESADSNSCSLAVALFMLTLSQDAGASLYCGSHAARTQVAPPLLCRGKPRGPRQSEPQRRIHRRRISRPSSRPPVKIPRSDSRHLERSLQRGRSEREPEPYSDVSGR